MNEPVFLSEADALGLHRRGIDQHGGMDGLRDPGAFASALHQPEAVWFYTHGDLFELAAAYAFHLAQNQPFIDGNKRAALATALAFLELNGVNTSPCPDESFYDALIAIAEKRLDKAGSRRCSARTWRGDASSAPRSNQFLPQRAAEREPLGTRPHNRTVSRRPPVRH